MAKKDIPPDEHDLVVKNIPISAIVIGNQRVRVDENDDDIIELAASIATRGLFQPIGVTFIGDGKYQLRWGLRRLTAFKRLHRTEIPANLYPSTPDPIEGVALIENLFRRDLDLAEECNAVTRLHKEDNLSPAQICDLIGKKRAWVLNRLAIPNFPTDIREPLLDGRIALGAAESIATIEDEGLRNYVVQNVISTKPTVDQTRQLVEAIKAAPNSAEAVQAGVDASPGGSRYQEPHLKCEACQQMKPMSKTTMIRICTDGCAQPETPSTEKPDAH